MILMGEGNGGGCCSMSRVKPPPINYNVKQGSCKLKLTKIKDSWNSHYPLEVKLVKPIENVVETCKELIDFIKLRGLPIGWDKITFWYARQQADENFNSYWEKAFVIFHIKKKSLLARLNPKHNGLEGDETLAVQILRDSSTLQCWQEAKKTHRYGGYGKYNWKMSLEDIKGIRERLEEFADRNEPEKVEFT